MKSRVWKSGTEISFHDPGDSEAAKILFLALTLKIQQIPENTGFLRSERPTWESLQCVLSAVIGWFGRSSWKTEDIFLSGEKGNRGVGFQEKLKSDYMKGFEDAAKYGSQTFHL